jgi:hypothetical protein
MTFELHSSPSVSNLILVCITLLLYHDKSISNLPYFYRELDPDTVNPITVTKITEIVQIFTTDCFLDTQTYLSIASDKLHWSNYSEQMATVPKFMW